MNDVPASSAKQAAKVPVVANPINWIRGEIDRLFEDFGAPTRSMFFGQRPTIPVPAMELSEGKKEYRLTAELPGLSEGDVDIAVADGVLTISGEKKEEQEHKENGYLMSERRYGAFQRQIALPADVDPNAIKAKFKDGVLSVSLAKDSKAAPRTRKIAIEK